MIYDSAWDMPRVNWRQQGSFEQGEIPPASDPDSGTLVCLPPINQAWLPYILGCMDQMRNPSSWLVADDDAMYATLLRVDRLKQMIGGRAPCFMYQLRFTAECELQYSTDSGATWTTVAGWAAEFPACNPPQTVTELTSGCELKQSFDGQTTWEAVGGWDTYFKGCVQAAVPVIGPPPNPIGQPPAEFTCSIASYLAEDIILASLSKAVTAIQDDLTLLNFGANILSLAPEFILVAVAYDAFTVIYTSVQEGVLTDYEDAIADPGLWLNVTCAIYTSILADGYVTPGNFAAIVTAVEGITYTHPAVITVIKNYLNSLGATGLAQLSQRAGLLVGADCSSCGGPPLAWCYQWLQTKAVPVGTWSVSTDSSFGSYNAATNEFDASDASGAYRCYVEALLDPALTYTHFLFNTSSDPGPAGDQIRVVNSGGTIILDTGTSRNWTGSLTGAAKILVGPGGLSGYGPFSITELAIGAGGVNPYGVDNCTF